MSICIGEYIYWTDPPWESFMDRYMSVINFLMWLLVWIVLRPEVTTVPYIRSYVLWYRQTSPVTGWTIKAITGYVTNYAEGCEWCRWDLSLPYDGIDIVGPLDRVELLKRMAMLEWVNMRYWAHLFELVYSEIKMHIDWYRGWHGLCLIGQSDIEDRRTRSYIIVVTERLDGSWSIS